MCVLRQGGNDIAHSWYTAMLCLTWVMSIALTLEIVLKVSGGLSCGFHRFVDTVCHPECPQLFTLRKQLVLRHVATDGDDSDLPVWMRLCRVLTNCWHAFRWLNIVEITSVLLSFAFIIAVTASSRLRNDSSLLPASGIVILRLIRVVRLVTSFGMMSDDATELMTDVSAELGVVDAVKAGMAMC